MIFTPEESREIAEMLGFEDCGGEREVFQDDVCVGSAWDEHWQDPDGNPINQLPDFSLPEWTGPMLEAVLHDYWDQIRVRTSKKRLAVIATRWYDESREFFSAFTNRNLFDAWKWLREPKETSRE